MWAVRFSIWVDDVERYGLGYTCGGFGDFPVYVMIWMEAWLWWVSVVSKMWNWWWMVCGVYVVVV